MWETIDDALNMFYWELRMFILDVVYHCIGPWNFSLLVYPGPCPDTLAYNVA